MLTVQFHTGKPGDMAYACAALFLVGDKFALLNGFTIACSRNAATARWVKMCGEKDARLVGAVPLQVQVVEPGEHECASTNTDAG